MLDNINDMLLIFYSVIKNKILGTTLYNLTKL